MSALWPKGPRQWVLVPGKGIEPLTRSLQGCRSATELDRRIWFEITYGCWLSIHASEHL